MRSNRFDLGIFLGNQGKDGVFGGVVGFFNYSRVSYILSKGGIWSSRFYLGVVGKYNPSSRSSGAGKQDYINLVFRGGVLDLALFLFYKCSMVLFNFIFIFLF